jgi:hypothetical protein
VPSRRRLGAGDDVLDVDEVAFLMPVTKIGPDSPRNRRVMKSARRHTRIVRPPVGIEKGVAVKGMPRRENLVKDVFRGELADAMAKAALDYRSIGRGESASE